MFSHFSNRIYCVSRGLWIGSPGRNDGNGSAMRFANGGVALALGLAVAGCNLHAMTGDMMSEYTVEHMGPYLLTTDDLGMACETGVSMTGYLMSFRRVTDPPDKAAISGLVSAAACAEDEAAQHELRQMRALRAGNAAEAQDARIAEKQAHATAARRFLRAWQNLVSHYGEPGDRCPDLGEPNDEINYLLGLLAGVQAVQHDRAANGAVGVELDVPRKAIRGARCLNDEKWWGVPTALQAAVWVGVPGAAPEGADPWKTLAAASETGRRAGVRLADAIHAHAAAAAGRDEDVKKVIVAHVAARQQQAAPAAWRLLDANATHQLEVLSDRIWTQAVGHRTPIGGLGTFPGEQAAPQADDSLLGDLVEEEPAPSEAGETTPEATQPKEEQ